METYVYGLLLLADVVCVLVCSIKIQQNREENLSRMKLLRKLQRERIELKRERIALKRERALTDAAVKRARACKFD